LRSGDGISKSEHCALEPNQQWLSVVLVLVLLLVLGTGGVGGAFRDYGGGYLAGGQGGTGGDSYSAFLAQMAKSRLQIARSRRTAPERAAVEQAALARL